VIKNSLQIPTAQLGGSCSCNKTGSRWLENLGFKEGEVVEVEEEEEKITIRVRSSLKGRKYEYGTITHYSAAQSEDCVRGC